MSFNDKNFWMPKDTGCLTDGKMGLGASSKEEQKCHQLWNAAEGELFSRKKQAVESIDNRPIPATANMNISLWGSSSSSGSGQFNDHHFVLDPLGTTDLADPLSLNGEIGKGNVAQVRNSMDPFCMSIGRPQEIKENNKIPSSSTNQTNSNSIPFQPAHGKEDQNSISLGPSYKANVNFISMDQTLNRGVGDLMLMGHQYHRANDNMISMLQPFNKASCGFISLDQQYGVGSNNFKQDGPGYNKEHENFVMMGPSYGKSSENFKLMIPIFDNRDAVITSMNPNHHKEDVSPMSMGITFDTGNSSNLSMGQKYDVGDSGIISFGIDANSSSGGFSSSDILTSQSSVQVTKTTTPGESTVTNVNQVTKVNSSSKNDGVSKNKEQKKSPANNFPANVKSMLSTGIFDGVPVKYVSWSREKSLRGVIRGSGYLCGCEDCKFLKVLNAYEFERHAGCKTKHPNNHIYFENGKTVYSVVQELKSTTQETLFEVIQNVTGSPINQKNFRSWKVSYQAASLELERIYGQDEKVVQS